MDNLIHSVIDLIFMTFRGIYSMIDSILSLFHGPVSDYQKNQSNETYSYKEDDLKTLDVPIINLTHAQGNPELFDEELRKGLAMGAFWVDVGEFATYRATDHHNHGYTHGLRNM